MKSKLLFLAVAFAFALPASAATRSWTNTAGGNWFVAANWSPNVVPNVLDTANITNNGTYSVNILTGTVAVASINLGAASGTQTLLNGSANNLAVTNLGTVRANGILSITNGGLQGRVTIQAGGQLQLSGSSTKAMYSLTLINQGTVTWSGGLLQAGGTPTTVVSNGGLWQVTTDNQFYNAYGGLPMTWTNTGTLRKSAGSGISYINDFNLVNQPGGVIDTLSGTLSLSGGTNSTLGGSLTATAPGLMTISGGTWTDAGGVASGTGTNRFHGGTLNLRTNIIPGLLLSGGNVFVTGLTTFQQAGAITNLTLDGSQLKGSNRVGNGTLTVNSGGVDGQLIVQAGGQLVLATAATKAMASLTLINQGTVTWSGGLLQAGGTPTTVVSNGGLWQVTTDNQFYNAYGGGTPMTWTNTGTLRKSAGSGISYITDFNLFNQPGGVIDTLSGTLFLSGGTNSTLGGTFTATSPGLMTISGGTWTDAGGTTSGSGTNRFHGGTLNLRTNIIPGLLLTGGNVFVTGLTTFQQAGAITNLTLDGSQLKGSNRVGNGMLTVNSGGVDGQLIVQSGGQLVLATAATKAMNSLTLINQGTVTWSGGLLQAGGTPTTVVSNGGLWQVTGDNQFYNAYGGLPMTWTNAGTLRKSAGSGISYLNDFNLVNQPGGVIDTLSGTLALSGGTNSTLGGSLTATSPGLMTISGGTWTDAGGVASGTGINRFHGGTFNLRTNIIPGLLLTGGNVFVTGLTTFQQAGAITNMTLDGAQLKGSNRVGNGTLTVNSGGMDGQLIVQTGGQLVLATAATKAMNSLTLINQGTVTWSGGLLQAGGTPTTVVSNGGLWQVTGDNQFYNAYGGLPMTWTNAGTLRKSAGSGISYLNDFNLVNQPDGVIDTLSGTLSLSGGTNSTLGGSLTATSPGLMTISGGTWADAGGTASGTGINRFHGGTLNLRTNIIPGLLLTGGNVFVTGTTTFQQAGAITNLTLDGAQLKGSNRVGNGTLTVNSGGVDGQLIVQAGGQLVLATAATKAMNSLTLINQGTVTWSGGLLQAGGTPTTVVSNGGLWQVTGDNQFYNAYGGSTLMTWTNTGTLRKSAGTGVSYFSDFGFVNQASGLIQADTGTLQLPTPITNSAGTLRLNGGTLQNGGTYAMTGGMLEGAGAFGANAITGGIVSPGQAGPGLMGFKSGLNIGASATLSLSGTGTIPGTQYDQLSVTGAVALANATLQVTALPAVAPGTTFVLILNDGTDAVTGTFNGLAENAAVNVGGQIFRIRYAGGSGNDVTLVRDSGSASTGALITSSLYTNGTFRLFAIGSNTVVYGVQATTNFIQWTNIGFATGGLGGTFTFADTNAFRYQYRFYRTTN